MATKIASLYAELGADSTKLNTALKDAKTKLGETKTATGQAKDALAQLTGVSITGAGAIAAVTTALKFSIDAAIDAEKADANLNATLKSTQYAAGLSADEVKRYASNLSDMSGQDDEAIQNAESMLLTFTKIGREVFPQAAEAVVNMAAKFGGLDTAAVQLGKALQDPISGVSALKRVGVVLSDEQENQIKKFMAVNDVAGAQKIILGELQTEFGGLAAAMGDTLEGKINRLHTSLGNLGEKIGGVLIPVLADAADAANQIISNDEKLNGALSVHRQEIIKTSGTYEDYVIELTRSSLASQSIKRDTEELRIELQNSGRDLSTQATELGGLSRAEYDAAQLAIQGENEKKDAMDRSRDALATYLGAHDEGKMYNYSLAVGQAANATLLLKEAQDKEKAAMDLVNAALGEYNRQQLFSVATEGLNAQEKMAVGVALGVISQSAYDAYSAQENLNAQYKDPNNQESLQEYVNKTISLADGMDRLHSVDVTITTRYKTIQEYGSENQDSNRGGPGVRKEYAAGGSFTIPLFYGYEGYPLGPGKTASGGETVTVTPAGQSAQPFQFDYYLLAQAVRDGIQAAGMA